MLKSEVCCAHSGKGKFSALLKRSFKFSFVSRRPAFQKKFPIATLLRFKHFRWIGIRKFGSKGAIPNGFNTSELLPPDIGDEMEVTISELST
jgi:hypothetical protein